MRIIKSTLISALFVSCWVYSLAQSVGIGTTTPAPGAVLDVTASDKGILIPRVETSAITSPIAGLLVFQPSNNMFYYYNGTAWKALSGGVIDADGDTKAEAIDQPGNDKISLTLDGVEKLVVKRNAAGELVMQPQNFAKASTYFGLLTGESDNGSFNTGIGAWALQVNSSGSSNTAIGANALNLNTSGMSNTALGQAALLYNGAGSNNVALGKFALASNTTGSNNVAIGRDALGSNTVRDHIVAIGDSALFYNGTGSGAPDAGLGNLAIGSKAMLKMTFGRYNTAVGQNALKSSAGLNALNTAVGYNAMIGSTSGSSNTGIGAQALGSLQTGETNTALGTSAIALNTSGNRNIAIGWTAGLNNLTGSNNIFIGTESGYDETGSNKLYIENSNANADSALIYGDFNTNLLRANAQVQVNTYAPGVRGVQSIIKSPPGTTIDVPAVYGENTVTDFYGYGVYGKSGYIGVRGEVNGTGQGLQSYYALYGSANGSTTGTNYAVYGNASGGAKNWGGYFNGDGYFSNNLGIGTTSPSEKLHIFSPNDPTLLLQSDGVDEVSGKVAMRQSNFTGADIFYDGVGAVDAFVIETFTNGTSNGRKFTLDLDGNVGIGITENIAAGHRLSVNGKIACTEVRVQPQSAWPDYVFDQDYALMPIDALKASLDTHKHLPGIPSADEIEEHGQQLGDMQRRMLQKMEELTLYVIQLNDEVANLKEENVSLQNAIQQLTSNR